MTTKKQRPQQQQTTFKLPDDFAQKMEEIKRIIAALEELKANLGNQSRKPNSQIFNTQNFRQNIFNFRR